MPTTMSDLHLYQKARRQRERDANKMFRVMNPSTDETPEQATQTEGESDISAGGNAQQASLPEYFDEGTGEGATEKNPEEVRAKEDTYAGAQAEAAAGDLARQLEQSKKSQLGNYSSRDKTRDE